MKRLLTALEKEIILKIFEVNNIACKYNLNDFFVEEMNDGGMGSVEFISDDLSKNRHYGSVLGEVKLLDADGMEAFASIIFDQYGDIFQLDIFKGDSSQAIDFKIIDAVRNP